MVVLPSAFSYRHSAPTPDRYFAHPLLLWMPRKLWRSRLYCPHSDTCEERELTSAGIYPHVQQVVDIDGFYNLAAEYLECKNCNRKIISRCPEIVKQLDQSHRVQFPVIAT